ncbi:putative aldo-keto reductase [Kockovaella imperatae]|uniref:Putative aldo-keto reductase n=1 Tax=Kockovaella imperatae TaxID=4999 RepID=A0A1Y1UKK2_9TREE|nr:putative aldo-keto reductase [Kockovaella imperatae]ORX38590.1 putative aldo-keto reductase [Kockovaella imperatae]
MSEDMSQLTIKSTFKLLSGNTIPRFGLGVYQSRGEECFEAVKEALKADYRHVDSAQMYRNEELVGKAVIESGVPRSEVFITTKYNPNHKIRTTEDVYQDLKSSLPKIDPSSEGANGSKPYIDLMLIHAPWGGDEGRGNNWAALAKAQKEGWIKDIGVSNFGAKQLENLPEPVPVINQIELHPWCQQRPTVAYCQKKGIAVEAYTPLVQAHKERFQEPKLLSICKKHGKDQAQVLIRWSLQKGYVVIPKSVTPSRIRSNAQVYDFNLDKEDMDALDSLDMGADGAVTWNPVDKD